MKFVIKTKRFMLRPYRMADAAALARNINDRTIYRNTLRIPHPYGLRDARDFIKKAVPEYRKRAPRFVHFAIDIAGEVVGCVGLTDIRVGHKCEVGYWLARRLWGQGIVTEAVGHVIRFAYRRFHVKRLYACTFVFNAASANVLKKNGFTLEGRLRKNILKDGKLYDDYLWGRVR